MVLNEKGTKIWNHQMENHWNVLTEDLNGNIGLNYQINEHHTFGAKYKVGKRLKEENPLSKETNITVDDVFYDNIKVTGKEYRNHKLEHELNAYYNGQAGKLNIDFNVDYFQNGNAYNAFSQEISQTSDNRVVHSINNVKTVLLQESLPYLSLWQEEHLRQEVKRLTHTGTMITLMKKIMCLLLIAKSRR